MRSTTWLCFALSLAACDESEVSRQTGSATASASPAASATVASTKTAAKADGSQLRLGKPKAYGHAQQLGTLPEGVGVAVGEKAPPFTLKGADGKKVELAALLNQQAVMLFFYRGGW